MSDTITVVRKNGKIYDFVLTGEQILDYEVVSKESLALVLEELNLTKFHNREYIP
ncbi:competence regulator inhibitor paratox [Streptococcus suis]|uniref:competence regulator inhibitor paratox n=1 Tax=Streptococcus suis TaxID=1307 RepID=UPI000425FD0C